MTSLPADNLRLVDRGRLVDGAFADVAVFDPRTVADRATYDDPHTYAAGVRHVVVNGGVVVRDGELTARARRAGTCGAADEKPSASGCLEAGDERADDEVPHRVVVHLDVLQLGDPRIRRRVGRRDLGRLQRGVAEAFVDRHAEQGA